jgi:hypothetical protein
MLTAIPRSFFSWGFVVCRDGQEIAGIDTALLYEGGTLHCGASVYRLGKTGAFSGEFFLEQGGVRIATAHKSTLVRRFKVEHAGQVFTLAARSAFARCFVLKVGDCVIGRIAPESWLSRKSSIEMPTDMPLAVQLWLFWLAVLMWRREAAAASS